MKLFSEWFFANIHTLLLLAGALFIAIGAFLISVTYGFFISGVLMIILGLLINKNSG